MLASAKKSRKEANDAWLRLPNYSYLEASILGAIIKETVSGARVAEKAFSSAADLVAPHFADSERVNILAKAIGRAAAQGYPVMVDINGPLTILDSLLPTALVYKMLRKDDTYLKDLTAGITEIAALSIRQGASMISFADPLATADLLGKKNLVEHFLPLLKKFTDGIAALCPDHSLHICGKLSQDLVEADVLSVTESPVPADTSLATALIDKAKYGGQHLLGLSCVNHPNARVNAVYELHWQ